MSQQTTDLKTGQEVKEEFARQGVTMRQWAKQHGFKPQMVYQVVNGLVRANYGKSHEVAMLLGMKSSTAEQQN